jgi:selenide,water dikinase
MPMNLVLAGGGHSHALVLRRWARQRRRWPHRGRPQERCWPGSGTAVTLVSRSPLLLYSGLLPGLLAGLKPRAQCSINLEALCRAAGVRFVQAEISGLDPQQRQLLLAHGPALPWDWLSLDVGAMSTPAGDALGVKPLEPLLAWLEIQEATDPTATEPVVIRGGGAAALEVALALRGRGRAVELLLRGQHLQLGNTQASRLGEQLLQAAAVPLQRQVADSAAAALACTGSRGPSWLAAAGLPVNGQGRLQCSTTLQVQGWPRILASGDCAVVSATPRPAAGVWAVAQAPTLARNLERLIEASSREPDALRLQRWRPRRHALQLLADCSDPARPRALLVWGRLCLGPSRWLWHWKQWIDHRFVDSFRRP